MKKHECDEEFFIRYNGKKVLVQIICEGSDMHFMLDLPQGQLKILHDVDEEGRDYWIQNPGGETELAKELGNRIEFGPLPGLVAV